MDAETGQTSAPIHTVLSRWPSNDCRKNTPGGAPAKGRPYALPGDPPDNGSQFFDSGLCHGRPSAQAKRGRGCRAEITTPLRKADGRQSG